MKWISVKDRLPDSDGIYIVTACDEGCSAGEGIWYDTVVVVAEYYNGCWTWYDSGNEYDLDGIVTHWMPMPEPQKEEPAVDAVEIVRCKDCVHSAEIEGCAKNLFVDEARRCLRNRGDNSMCLGVSIIMPNGFCDAGERRTDEAG